MLQTQGLTFELVEKENLPQGTEFKSCHLCLCRLQQMYNFYQKKSPNSRRRHKTWQEDLFTIGASTKSQNPQKTSAGKVIACTGQT